MTVTVRSLHDIMFRRNITVSLTVTLIYVKRFWYILVKSSPRKNSVNRVLQPHVNSASPIPEQNKCAIFREYLAVASRVSCYQIRRWVAVLSFRQDSARTHFACKWWSTVQLLHQGILNFISPKLWSNSPEMNLLTTRFRMSCNTNAGYKVEEFKMNSSSAWLKSYINLH